jgi:hypothetical protein
MRASLNASLNCFHEQLVAKAVIRSECAGSRTNLSHEVDSAHPSFICYLPQNATHLHDAESRNKFAALTMGNVIPEQQQSRRLAHFVLAGNV